MTVRSSKGVVDLRKSLADLKLALSRNWQWLGLILIGLTSQLLYVRFFLKPYPLFTYYDVPLLDLGKIAGYSFDGAFDFAAAFFLLFTLCYMAYVLCRGQSSPDFLIVILPFAFLSGLTLVLVYPITAADIFDYLLQGRVMAYHGANPYLYTPLNFPLDPFLRYSAWPFITSPYGPLWSYISAGVTLLAGSSLLSNLLLFKGLALVVHLLNAGLIYAILARWQPAYALAGTVLYAWNPLVLFESAANAHNDGLMMFFILLAIYLYLRGRFALAVPIAVCSCLVKLPTIILAPLFFLGGWRALSGGGSRRRFLIVSGSLTAALVLLLYAPLWEGLASLSWLERQEMFTTSFAAVAFLFLRQWIDQGLAGAFVQYAALLLFGLFYLWQLARLRSQVRPFLFALYWTVFVFLTVAVLWFQPWYLVWLVPLGAILPSLAIADLTTLFSYTVTWDYLVFIFFLFWHFELMIAGKTLGMNVISVLFVFIPPLAYAGYILGRAKLVASR
jgi:hypothetical protein